MAQGDGSQTTLSEIFGKVNMSELPAMSDHVQELIGLLNSSKATAQEIAAVILKDASLTAKLLQVANSAYYLRGVPVTSVTRAITAVGMNTIKELALTLSLFDDFLKAGVEKEEISKLLAKSFLSATTAKFLCAAKKIRVQEEDVFICTLLHELGKIIILVYLPELYRSIQALLATGCSEEHAAKSVLGDLSFARVGMEIARFWNFSEKIVLSMATNPPPPTSRIDSQLYLLNVAAFCNRLTAAVSRQGDWELNELLRHFGPMMNLSREEALALIGKGMETAEDMSAIIRYGLSKLKLRSKLSEKGATA